MKKHKQKKYNKPFKAPSHTSLFCAVCECVPAGERVNGVDPGGGVQTPLFDCSSDWDREIKRTGASEWRVCSINEGYLVSPRCVCVCVFGSGCHVCVHSLYRMLFSKQSCGLPESGE